MWLRCSVLGFLGLMLLVSLELGNSLQATSVDESQVLWNMVQEGFVAGEYEKTLFLLRRYIVQYPGSPFFLKADAWMGKCLLKLHRPKEACVSLQSWINSGAPEKETIGARVDLAEAYFQLKKFNEAQMVVRELAELQKKNLLSDEEILNRWIIAARAYDGLKQLPQAIWAIETAIHLLKETTPAGLRAQMARIRLEFKYQQCLEMKLKKLSAEDEIQSSIHQQGFCLLEGIPLFREVFKTQSLPEIRLAREIIQRVWKSYEDCCLHPPVRTLSSKKGEKPKKLSEQSLQKMRNQQELVDALLHECRTKRNMALDLLRMDRSLVSTESKAVLEEMEKNLKSLWR